MEEKTDFISNALRIEGLIDSACTSRGVVVTHPHPLYGGNMHNPVVEALVTAYRQQGRYDLHP